MIPELLKPDFTYEDFRGTIISHDDSVFREPFVKTNITMSRKNVIRGFHVSPYLSKLFTCVYGTIYIIVVSCRDDEMFGSMWKWTLSDRSGHRVLVPPGYGVAHLVMTDIAVVQYSWTGAYDGPAQKSYAWDAFGDIWPIKDPIVSERDRLGKFI